LLFVANEVIHKFFMLCVADYQILDVPNDCYLNVFVLTTELFLPVVLVRCS
jgi:hypothetical protein